MTFKENMILWLLKKLVGKECVHPSTKLNGSLQSEVKTLHHIAFESIIQSLIQRSVKAQLIFLHMYLHSMGPEILDKVARYAMFITRNREEGYVSTDAVGAARSVAQRGGRGTWKGNTGRSSVQSPSETVRPKSLRPDLDGQDQGGTGTDPLDVSPCPG